MGLFNAISVPLLLLLASGFLLWIGERCNWGDPWDDFEDGDR